MIHLSYKIIVFLLSINLLVPLLVQILRIQDVQESTSIRRKDEDTPSDSQKIVMKSLLLEETSKENISHQKAVSQTEILLDRKHSNEIDSLQISKLWDSSNKSKLSSEEFRISETFSGDEPSRALEITGKIRKYIYSA